MTTEKNLNAPEPAPTEGSGAEVWQLVIDDAKRCVGTIRAQPTWLIADMRARNEAGVAKYGTSLRVWNGRDAVVDAYQEGLDGMVYARQAGERALAFGKKDEVLLMRHVFSLFAEATVLLGKLARKEDGYEVPKEPPK